MAEQLKRCDNPNCDRFTSPGILYCCYWCSVAHEGKYEIHEDGEPLGHSEACSELESKRTKEASL